MANIKRYTDDIRKAIYGKEVRESLATGIEVINTEVEENTNHVNETITDIKNFKNDINLAEQQRVSAENKRISDENTRVSNEEHRKETFRQIVDENSTWDSKLSNLYNHNNSELNDLKNSFKSKYDNLEAEYANDIHDIKDKYISRCPKRIDSSTDLNNINTGGNYIVVANTPNTPINGYGRLVVIGWDNDQKWITQIFYTDITNEIYTRCSLNAEATSWTPWNKLISTNEADNKYLNKNLGTVSDFNLCKTEGIYNVTSENISNAPFESSSKIYGKLIVYVRDRDITHMFISHDNRIFLRFCNNGTSWGNWTKIPTMEAFEGANSQTSGYQKLPSGIIIQWGSTVIPFDGYRAHGYLYYPIAFKEYVHCCGNVASNDYGGFCETTGTVSGDNLSRAYAEALDVGNGNRQGHNVRFQWIAIGR